MRNFFFASAGIFLLTLAFHFSSVSAVAQTTGPFVSIGFDNTNGYPMALTSDGRVFIKSGTTWILSATIGGVTPVPVSQQSWGQVKARYR